MFDRPDPDFVLGEVVQVIDHNDPNSPYGGVAAVVEFKNLKSDGSPVNKPDVNGDYLTRVNIFEPPSGGVATDFVLKTGDKMSGNLTFQNEPYNDSSINNVQAPRIVFNSKNSSGTATSAAIYKHTSNNWIYTTGAFRAGGDVSAKGNILYDGNARIKFGGQNSKQYLCIGSTNALEWNEAQGVYGIKANNQWGSTGQIIKKASGGYIYWSSETQADWNTTSSSSPSYIKNKPTIPDVKYTITKDTNGNFYVQ